MIPGPTQWVKDPVFLWLWHRPAAAAPGSTPAQERPDAACAAIKREREREKEGTSKIFGRNRSGGRWSGKVLLSDL